MSVKELSPELEAELAALATMRDEDIDTDDIPELPAEHWAWAIRPAQCPPGGKVTRICLDAEVVEWLQRTAPAEGYAAAINRALREHIAGR